MFNEITLETYNAQLDCLLALQDNLIKEYYMEMYYLEGGGGGSTDSGGGGEGGGTVEGKAGDTNVTTDKASAEANSDGKPSFSDKVKKLADRMSQWITKMSAFVAQSVQKSFLIQKIQKIVNMQYVKMSTKNNLFEYCVEAINNNKKDNVPICTKVDNSFQPKAMEIKGLLKYEKDFNYKEELEKMQNENKNEMAMFQKGDQEKVYAKKDVDTYMAFLYGKVLQVQATNKKVDEGFKASKQNLSEEEMNSPNYQAYTKFVTTYIQTWPKIFKEALRVCNEMMKAINDAAKKANNKDGNQQNQNVDVAPDPISVTAGEAPSN